MNDETVTADFFDDELLATLARRILSMAEGERLPSERGLAEELGVSRTALRDRLGRLESMGVLERRTGSGSFVRGLRPESISESLMLGLVASQLTVASLRSVRFALERQAAYEAAQRVSHVEVARMAVAVDRMDASDDTQELYDADIEFHRALFAASESPALIFFSNVLQGVLSRTLQHLELSDDRIQMRKLHRAIYSSVSLRDPASSMRAIDEHFLWLEELVAKNQHSPAAVTDTAASR
ncbi:FCD domain-containing protein [Arthrobacter sp. SIMBA_036]|uniref:FadR/GntR family transcriptional regulator n=1 Tax=Arthrobacter sp. SIMBA_036 TaxID=3085778 RepID=UPI003978766C